MDRKWTRTFGVGVAALLGASMIGIIAPAAYATTAVTLPSLAASPFSTSTSSTYTVEFKTSASGALVAGTGTITITVGGGETLPTAPSSYMVDAAGVNSPASTVNASGSSVIITTPVVINASTFGQVTISGVTTPSAAGTYTATVATSSDTAAASASYTIGTATSMSVTTTSSPQSASSGTQFTHYLSARLRDSSGAAVSEGGVSVAFAAPTSGASGTFTSVSGPTTVTVLTDPTGLATAPYFFANGTVGTFTVTAVATIGTTPLPAANFTLTNTPFVATAPGAPTGVTAVGGNGSATVSWTAPGNGGSAITGYTVTSSPGGISASTTGTSVVVPGLSNGTGYTFTVTAANAVGTSPASAPSNAVVPQIPSSNGTLAPPVVGIASLPNGTGYWLADAAGGVSAHGAAVNYGSMAGQHLNAPITHIVATPTGLGYWLVAADGGTFTFGDAGFYGSMGNQHLNAPVVDIAPTTSGHGYWLVASDGGIFTFGDAVFHGSMGGQHLNKPVVGMAAGPNGGYWEVATDGGIFSFGEPFYGSEGGSHLNKPINGMSVTSDGNGYWFVASDGGIFSFGDAGFYGSTGGQVLNAPIVGMATGPNGGYWLAASDGGVFSFNAPFYGAD